jgi:glycosyltransferase involved in cell wall biosynthesis
MTPLEHFLLQGWKEGKDPGPWFETGWYLEKYAGQGLSDPNPVIDYLTTGAAQGRDPSPHFSTEWYSQQSLDLATTGLNPLFDFLAYGRAEGREPLPPEHRATVRDSREMPDVAAPSAASDSGGTILRLPVWPRSVLVVTDKVTATQEISFGQPLAALVNAGEITLNMLGDDKDWGDAAEVSQLLDSINPDILVLSRYTLPRSGLFVAAARERKIPTVFHIDDDLLDVPESLGKGKQTYRDPERLAALRNALDSSDLVYTSTEPLAQRLVAHGIRAPILHGDLYCTIDPGGISTTLPSTTPVIGYMGTSGHGEDLASVGSAIANLLDSMPALSFETFGTISPLPQLARFGQRVLHHGPVPNYTGFLQKLCDLGWWVGLAPLADNPFNRCKADTKWVEYTYAGIAVVAQDLPLYRRACADGTGILAAGETEWVDAIGRLLRSAHAREAMVRAARDKLRTVYSHAALCRQVLDVFKRARALHARSTPLIRARR